MINGTSDEVGEPLLRFLAGMAGQHVHFFPKSGNAGDGFIAHATYELFDRFKISYATYKQTETAAGEPVVIGGGGNLVEGRYADAANLIRRHSPRQIVVLPHTVLGYEDIVSRTNSNLTLFLRDPVSHALALANGANEERTFLSHDLVFFLEDTTFDRYRNPGRGTLRALRTDGESANTIPPSADNIDLSLSWNGDLWTDPQFCKASTETIASYISQFDAVVTDRLHISILSAMLGKRVTLLPNVYFKNRAIYEHSMRSSFPNVRFVNVLATSDTVDLSTNSQLDGEASRRKISLVEQETTRREAAERSLELCRQQLEEKDEEIARREHRIEGLGHLADSSRTRLEEAQRSEESFRTRLEEAQRSEESFRTRLEEAQRSEERFEEDTRRLKAEITAILGSTSWRATAPLRRIVTAFRGS